MKRFAFLAYGVICYLAFHTTMIYFVLFMLDIGIPHAIDSEPRVAPLHALFINFLLMLVFGIQHTVMARQGFKKWLTQFVPEPLERSTYVLLSCVALIPLFTFWEPVGGVIWETQSFVGQAFFYTLFAIGSVILVTSTFMIDHFDLFGLKQVYCYFTGKKFVSPAFKVQGYYKLVRHPIYVGWIAMFMSTPRMTTGHFIFAMLNIAYILVALYFEESDLVDHFGEDYVNYSKKVPMLIPGAPKSVKSATAASQALQ